MPVPYHGLLYTMGAVSKLQLDKPAQLLRSAQLQKTITTAKQDPTIWWKAVGIQELLGIVSYFEVAKRFLIW